MQKYQEARGIRREGRTIGGRFRGGKLAPVLAVPVRPSEAGALTQAVTFELDPIAGRMVTPPTAEVISVFVPVQAVHALKHPTHDYPGNTEVVRAALLSGTPLFGMEPETELSQRMGINPRSIGGIKQVCEISRIAHNAAVNYLRRKKYDKAAQLDATNAAMTPAIISQTVLDRLNGVLDPEDRVNGFVDMDITGTMIVRGNAAVPPNPNNVPAVNAADDQAYIGNGSTNSFLYSDLADANGGQISLTDLYQAERTDQLVRDMREMVDQHPEYGEEMLARWAHGLMVDPGRQPFVLYQRQVPFARDLQYAMDGASLLAGTEVTNTAQRIEFSVPVPKTELGGIVITFACLKPDEALKSQPHPILSQEWGVDNFVADEMAIDPVPVTVRDLYSDCAVADEGTVAFYVGNNHLKRTYIDYGFNRHLNPTTVAQKTAMWQLEVPLSVTPETVLYPADIDHYPFADNLAEVCTYTCNSMFRCATPTIFGPTPVEEMRAITDENLFEDQEAAV